MLFKAVNKTIDSIEKSIYL